MAKRILFLGSKRVGYQCLKHLIDHQKELDINIVGILTDPIAKVDTAFSLKALAEEHGLKVYPDLEFLDEGAKSDILISVQYHRILKKSHIDYGKVAINLHMAPLPEYRGCNQFSFAILNGDQEFGTTFHILDEGIDNGDILFEKRFEIPAKCSVSELFDMTGEESILLFKAHIADLVKGNFTRKPQSEYLPFRKTSLHFRKEIADLKKLDLHKSKEELVRNIRATSMPGYEPPYAIVDGEKVHYGIDVDGNPVQIENPFAPQIERSGIIEVIFGKNVKIVEPVNLYQCSIGEGSFIGPFVEIQKKARIGKNTKIQSHTFICELVDIGNDCFISHGVMFINDTFSEGGPAGGDRSKWKSTKIGNNVSIGTNATLLPVKICDNVVIGAGSVVTKDILEPGTYVGNPAKKIK